MNVEGGTLDRHGVIHTHTFKTRRLCPTRDIPEFIFIFWWIIPTIVFDNGDNMHIYRKTTTGKTMGTVHSEKTW
jgi:hypothetical protein